MLNITLDLDTGLAKLASATTIKAGADVPVTINTVRGATPSSPGASPAFELGICTDAAPPVLKAYLDEFDAENDHTFTGVLDANDERLVAFMAGKATANCQCEVAWTVAGQLEVAPNFAVPVQSRGIPSDPNSASGPHYYTETEVDALLAVLAARGAQVALVAATGNLTLSGTQTIDGVAVIAGDVVFAKSQTTAADRKRYAVAAGAWTAIDQPRAVVVQKGTVNAGLIFVLSAANTYAGITAADVDPAGTDIAAALGGKLDTTAQAADVDPAGTDIAAALGGKLDTSAQAADVDPNGSSISSALGGKLDTSAQAADVDPNGSAISSALGGKLDTTARAADVDPAGADIAAALGGKLPLAGGTMDENAIVTLFNGSKWQQSTPDKGIAGTAGFSVICSAGYEYKFALGFLFILSDGSSTVRKVLYAPAAPTATDDTTLGFTTDTTWEMADGTLYECTDATATAAVWEVVPATDATKLPLAGGEMTGAITNDGVINVNIGNGNTSSGTDATAVGKNNTASGTRSSAFGYYNTASGYYSSAVGYNNTASGSNSSAFGYINTASGTVATAVGYYNTASGNESSAFGRNNTASGTYSSAVGYSNTASGTYSSAVGYSNTASGTGSSAVGYSNNASGSSSSAFGYFNSASGTQSSAVGYLNSASGTNSSAVGYQNDAFGNNSSALGYSNTASGTYSTAVGFGNDASGNYSSAVGYSNTASGTSSSAFGHYVQTGTTKATELGQWDSATARNGAIRLHTTGMAAITVQDRATEYGDAAQAETVTITSSGTTATVSLTAHGYNVGSKITVAGSNEAEYNGDFTVTAVGGANAFDYETLSTPSATPATGTITCVARLGSERDNRLARGMFAIRRNGLAFYLDYNDGGTIKNISLGTAA